MEIIKPTRMTKAKYIKAFYNDDEKLVEGLKTLKSNNVEILDVLTPFPVHGLDKILGYRRSWIARAGFIGGAIGAISGFYFQTWVFTKSYPLNFGGKPYFSAPSFIPITFELTVLCAALAMVFAFLIRSKIGPGSKPFIHDERITDDRFVVLVGAGKDESEESTSAIITALNKSGAMEITVKDDQVIAKNY
jgi:hypothetical protein